MRISSKKMIQSLASAWVVILLTCTGLVKLQLNPEYYNSADPGWPIIYASNSRHNAVDSDLLPPYEIVWETGTKSAIPDQILAIDNYLIFTSKNGNLTFLDIEKGDVIGESRIAPGFEHAPIIDGQILFYAANLGNETLVALNLLNLKKIWTLNLPHLYTSPLIWKDRIYVGTKDGRLFCVDKKLGETFWHFNAKASLFGVPAEKEGKIYFCDVKGSAYCIDGLTGKNYWITALQPNIYSGPVIGKNKLFIGTTAGIFYALDLISGEILWEMETGSSIYSNASYKDNVIYFGNNAHKIFALNADNGHAIWEFQTQGIVNSTPLLGGNLLYIGSWDHNLYILSQNSGELIQRVEFKRPIKSSPLLYKSNLFIHVANDHLFCLGKKDQTDGGKKK